jgi:hypothetical protein
MKLMLRISTQYPNWRENTVIMLDNAPYHRSLNNMRRYQTLKVPIMFLGPYHFKLAPIELFLSYLK